MNIPWLNGKNVVIKYNKSGLTASYIKLDTLFSMIENDVDPNISLAVNADQCVPQIYGITHYASGCHYLSHL